MNQIILWIGQSLSSCSPVSLTVGKWTGFYLWATRRLLLKHLFESFKFRESAKVGYKNIKPKPHKLTDREYVDSWNRAVPWIHVFIQDSDLQPGSNFQLYRPRVFQLIQTSSQNRIPLALIGLSGVRWPVCAKDCGGLGKFCLLHEITRTSACKL